MSTAPDQGLPGLEVIEHVRPFVREELDARSLHFSLSQTQSQMQILRPEALDLEYTRTMMGFLLFRPQSQRLAMIGLGGGSLAKFCHRFLPQCSMVVVEINPYVIALRQAFQVPGDDARFAVVQGDGVRFVAETDQRYDVLLVDGFDDQGMPGSLDSGRFYEDCHDVLTPDGVMVVNLHAGDPQLLLYVDRIRRCFGDAVIRVDDADASNAVVFAVKGSVHPTTQRRVARRPAGLAEPAWAQLREAFERIGAALARCGLFMSVGTSGHVYPAAGFVAEVRGRAETVELNLEPSETASQFDTAIHGPATQVVPIYVERLLARWT